MFVIGVGGGVVGVGVVGVVGVVVVVAFSSEPSI